MHLYYVCQTSIYMKDATCALASFPPVSRSSRGSPIAPGARAQDASLGCKILLCAAATNPDWSGIPYCVPPMTQLFNILEHGGGWPSCPEGDVSPVQYTPYKACPAGWLAGSFGGRHEQSGLRQFYPRSEWGQLPQSQWRQRMPSRLVPDDLRLDVPPDQRKALLRRYWRRERLGADAFLLCALGRMISNLRGPDMLQYESQHHKSDEGPLPELKVHEVARNITLIVGLGLALCLWDRVVTPGYFLCVFAFDAAAHPLNPARELLYRGPFPENVSPYAPDFAAIIFALSAYAAFRTCRSIARFFGNWRSA